MGYLEEIHAFDKSHVNTVIQDIQQEFNHSDFANDGSLMPANLQGRSVGPTEHNLEHIIDRLGKIERATQFVVDAVTRLLFSSKTQNTPEESKQ
jgi:hypothetical protein